MNKLALIFITAVLAVPLVGQTFPGCGERDYGCQLEAATKALRADRKNPDRYFDVALVIQRSGLHQEAIEAYTMYVSIPGVKAKDLADGYNNRGVSYRQVGQPGPALLDFVKASELVPGNTAAITNQGNARSDLKQNDAAFAAYGAALKIDPRYGPAYTGRAHLYNATHRYDEAIADFSKAIEYQPNEPENYYNRAVVYRKKGEHAKSIVDYDKYIPMMAGRNSKLADAYINRGIAYLNLARLDQALADFTKVIELDPKRANGYKARALVYRQMKKDDLAAADEKKATELAGER